MAGAGHRKKNIHDGLNLVKHAQCYLCLLPAGRLEYVRCWVDLSALTPGRAHICLSDVGFANGERTKTSSLLLVEFRSGGNWLKVDVTLVAGGAGDGALAEAGLGGVDVGALAEAGLGGVDAGLVTAARRLFAGIGGSAATGGRTGNAAAATSGT